MELMVSINGSVNLKMSELEAVTLMEVMEKVKEAASANDGFFNRTAKAVINDCSKVLNGLDKEIEEAEIRIEASKVVAKAEKEALANGATSEDAVKAGKEARKAYIKSVKGDDADTEEVADDAAVKPTKGIKATVE